jgi:hypothetical protein
MPASENSLHVPDAGIGGESSGHITIINSK